MKDYSDCIEKASMISEDLYNRISLEYGNSRIIMSGNDSIAFEPKKQKNGYQMKPNGLWYGIGTSWLDWIRSEMPHWERDNIFLLEIDDSKILKITNEHELLMFNDEYGEKKDYLTTIDWLRVSKDYRGIEITPYLHTMRMDNRVFWYYGWDVASGCIWGSGVIKGIIKL